MPGIWTRKKPLAAPPKPANNRGNMIFQDRIIRDPAVCGGQPIIRGTRVTVRTILGYLAHGESTAQILADFPSLTEEDLRTVVAFAAASASEDLPAVIIDGLHVAGLNHVGAGRLSGFLGPDRGLLEPLS
jgi:uncharacterized protein (DUF433 family)